MRLRKYLMDYKPKHVICLILIVYLGIITAVVIHSINNHWEYKFNEQKFKLAQLDQDLDIAKECIKAGRQVTRHTRDIANADGGLGNSRVHCEGE